MVFRKNLKYKNKILNLIKNLEEFFENELSKKFEEMIENNENFYFDSEEIEDLVIFYLEMGDTHLRKCRQLRIKTSPNSIELKVKQLEVLLDLERYVQARQLINELEPSCSETTDYLVCCAKYFSNNGNPRKSIDYC
jgi:hypothetical protein